MKVAALDPTTGSATDFLDIGDLHNAIKTFGYLPIRDDGSPFTVQEFEGGYLLDGAPLNVWIEGVWREGQQALLSSYWAAGSIPKPSQEVLQFGLTSLTPEEAANYQTFKQAQGAGISTPILIGGVLALGYLLTR